MLERPAWLRAFYVIGAQEVLEWINTGAYCTVRNGLPRCHNNDHKRGGLHRNVSSHSSGSQKSKIEVLERLIPLGALRQNPSLHLPALGGSGYSWLGAARLHSLPLSPQGSVGLFHIFLCFSYKDMGH